MKDKLLQMAARMFGANIVRHLLAAIGGFIGAQTDTTTGLLSAGLLYGISTGASWLVKRFPAWFEKDTVQLLETQGAIAAAAGSLASQGVALFAGWLLAHGYHGSPDDLQAVGLFLLNYVLSSTRPKIAAQP